VGKASKAPEQPKRFGLKEAEAAASYLGHDTAAAKPVLGVVCGVLGYENKVAEDVAAFKEKVEVLNADRAGKVKANLAKIDGLKAEIKAVEGENAILASNTATAKMVVAEKVKVAALFQG
jgi:hypothetical protein